MSTRKFFPAVAAVISACALAGPSIAGAATNPWTSATNAEQVGAAAAANGLQTGAAAAMSGWQAGANALATLPGPVFGGPAQLPLFANYGPTGPLGPLGQYGPLGGTSNLPTGLSAWNLGPTGPLGPGGPLG
jgi:hypothetical protein